MDQITPAMGKARAEELARRWIDNCLWHLESNHATTDGYTYLNAAEIAQMGELPAHELEALADLGGRLVRDEQKQTIRRAMSGRPVPDALKKIVADAGHALDVSVDRETADGRLASNLFMRAFATLLDEAGDMLAPVPRQALTAISTPARPDFKFLAFWDDFMKEKIAEKQWNQEMAADARATRKLFLNLIGDPSINKIGGDVAGRFRARYLELPWHYHTGEDWMDLTPTEVIEKVANLDEEAKKTLRTISPTTANKHIGNLIEYWDYLVRTNRVAKELDNPFRGHVTKRQQGRAARTEHPMWPPNLDRALFTSPLFSGCKSIHRRAQPGTKIHRDALFWVTLMGRTMGVREDEACGRKVGDIKFIETEIGTIPYLEIRDSKTPSSNRDVPLPGTPLARGFLEYRYYGRDPDEPLFPELPLQGIEPRRSPGFSTRFVYYRKGVKLYNSQFYFFARSGAMSKLHCAICPT